jgi:probable phosphomutase (TIGR03848 family)
MPTVVLVRHGRTTANAAGILAGRTPDVTLDEVGAKAAKTLADHLRTVELVAVVSSPLMRCVDSARMIAGTANDVIVDDRLTECDYGEWTGRRLVELRHEKLWRVIQDRPSEVTFPGGESLRAVQTRAVAAIREHDARLGQDLGPAAMWAAVSHADVIKAVVADALGMHLDHFQRLVIDPSSISIVTFAKSYPITVCVNSPADRGFVLPEIPDRRFV